MFPEPAYRIVLVQALAGHLLIDVNCSARRAAGWLQGLRRPPHRDPRPRGLRGPATERAPPACPALRRGRSSGGAAPASPCRPRRQKGKKHRAGRRPPPPAPLPPFLPSFLLPSSPNPGSDLSRSPSFGRGGRRKETPAPGRGRELRGGAEAGSARAVREAARCSRARPHTAALH